MKIANKDWTRVKPKLPPVRKIAGTARARLINRWFDCRPREKAAPNYPDSRVNGRRHAEVHKGSCDARK